MHVLAACSLYVPGTHCVHAVGAEVWGYEYVPAEQYEHEDVDGH